MKNKIRLVAVMMVVVFCMFSGCERKSDGQEDLLLSPVGDTEQGGQFDWGTSAGEGDLAGANSIKEESYGKDSVTTAGPVGASGQDMAGSGGANKGEEYVVHICGAVKNPGVYALEAGSRIYQAIEEAGGLDEEADGDYLNQADLIADGMKIYVPTKGEVEEAGISSGWVDSGGQEAAQKDPSLVNINTAGEELLCTLPGIGSSKAKSIIAYREKNGAFEKIEDIMKVEGIKDGLFQKIKDSITV